MKTPDRSRASPKRAACPPYKHPIDTHNEPILMTPTLRKTLRKTGEFKRSDDIRLVHYNEAKGETYVAYRWPSGRVQWYRHIKRIIRFSGAVLKDIKDIDDDDFPF